MEKGKLRKVFLSFLGLGHPETGYKESSYIDKEKNKIVAKVKYVQNAIVEMEEDKFDEKYIFTADRGFGFSCRRRSRRAAKGVRRRKGRKLLRAWRLIR